MKRFSYFLLLVFPPLLWSCQSEADSAASEASSAEPATATVAPSVTHLSRVAYTDPVRCQGFVEAPPHARVSVRVPVGGLIRDIRPLPGELVGKGTLLAELAHPDYLHLQQAYLETKAEYQYQQATLARQEALEASRATTARELDRSRADFATMAARLAGMKAELALLGIDAEALTPETIRPTIRIYSPRKAYITSVGVSVGEYAGPQEEICQLVELSHLHLEMAVYEQDRQRLRVGQSVTYQVAGSDRDYQGKVLLVGRQVAADGRAVQVHVEPENEEGLIPGAFVTATIETQADSLWLIPHGAIHDGGLGPEVWVQQAGASPLKVPVGGGRKTSKGYLLDNLPAALSPESALIEKSAGGGHSH